MIRNPLDQTDAKQPSEKTDSYVQDLGLLVSRSDLGPAEREKAASQPGQEPVTYRIAQEFAYVGNDYWRWAVWIETGYWRSREWIETEAAELDDVEEVVWILEPSFKETRIKTRQRSDKFRLSSAGWGGFLLRAELTLANGEKQLLKHYLLLERPNHSEIKRPSSSATSTAVRRPQTIYLSYSTHDSRVAAKLRTGLESAGLDVLDQTSLSLGLPAAEALQLMIARSDAVIGLLWEEEISPLVSAEIKAALASSKPALVVRTGSTSRTGLPKNVRTLSVEILPEGGGPALAFGSGQLSVISYGSFDSSVWFVQTVFEACTRLGGFLRSNSLSALSERTVGVEPNPRG